MKGKLRAYGYVRVSVDEEAGNNASIAAQAAAIRDYAEREGLELVEVFEDLDVSGRKLSRKQFDRMMGMATSPERPVQVILVYALSRFARRLLTQVTSEHRLAEAQVHLVSLTENFAQDATGRMMRSVVAIMNEKYAADASLFTRRDRRGNARKGYFNGGPVPFGYEARTVAVDGKKERRKLFLVEEEAAVVRLIFDLALRGLDGQPMGTRKIAEHLNANGYSLRGRPFHNSNVDGILTRDHYAGAYLDRTADDQGVTPSEQDAITVPCPQIIAPELIAQVAARRAKAAPRVTPPRVTNSPVLLTGLAHCGSDGCRSGLTIRTGKGGQYGYYTCNAKATAGAARCDGKPIRQDALDAIVLDTLLERVLEPERLKLLLAQVLERSDAADQRRRSDLDRVRREKVTAETRLGRLYGLIEEGLASARDSLFAERLAEHRNAIARLGASERSLSGQLAAGKRRIDEATVERFGTMLRDRLTIGDAALRRNYVRLFVSDITVSNAEITIAGTRAALEAAVSHGERPGTPTVPSFDREWCRLQDSNL
ncbi:recombinase family protein [Sphingomonas bacterium]|uniref:recombinase family protein n=1 Tax=Sphingomonas bacterium TaxID=1895847 RepID=UPI001575897A|nr:recombinase family protein [Sphingomonas bacterium]